MNTQICRAGDVVAVEGNTRVYIPDPGPRTLLRLTVLAAGREASLGGAVPLAARDRVYLPSPAFTVRSAGRMELRVEPVPAWPLRSPLLETRGAAVGRGVHADPRLAVHRAACDLAAYLAATRSVSRSQAYACIGLFGDARLLDVEGATVVAEVSLPAARAVPRDRGPARRTVTCRRMPARA